MTNLISDSKITGRKKFSCLVTKEINDSQNNTTLLFCPLPLQKYCNIFTQYQGRHRNQKILLLLINTDPWAS